jgi:hypothetical protein
MILRRGNHITPFSLDRLHHNTRYFFGGDNVSEDRILDGIHTGDITFRIFKVIRAAITVPIGNMDHPRHERAKMPTLNRLARGEGQCP